MSFHFAYFNFQHNEMKYIELHFTCLNNEIVIVIGPQCTTGIHSRLVVEGTAGKLSLYIAALKIVYH